MSEAVDVASGPRNLRAICIRLAHARFQPGPVVFLADFAPHDAGQLAGELEARGVPVKPLNDPVLGSGFMRVTTALPEDNQRFLTIFESLLNGRSSA